jgi:hypothetical protein
VSVVRTLRKLVLGETWTLPVGVALVLLAGVAVRAADGPLWHRGGGPFLLLGVLLVLVAAAPRRQPR